MNKRKYLRRIGISLLVLVLSITFLWLSANGPSSSAEMAFRRKEKQNLIGPAEIFAEINFYYGTYDCMMIGRSEYGYTFYEYRDAALDDGKLTYVPKKEGATLYCTYNRYGSERYGQDWLPIFALVDTPKAHTARLILTTTDEVGETVHYPLAAQRNAAGYFLFSWHTGNLRHEDYWLVQQLIARQHTAYILDGSAQATLELYDANGNLLETYHFTK